MQQMATVMFDYHNNLFVPDIDGLPETDYVETMTALLGAGFLVGYSLLLDSIVVGTVTSCGFKRLVPINRPQAGGIFRRTADLMATLDGIQEADEEALDPVRRDWKQRPSSMRCAAFSAMLKAGVIFDSALQNHLGRPNDDEINIIHLRAIHDHELRAALGDKFKDWAGKHMKPDAQLPPKSEPTDFVWVRHGRLKDQNLLYPGDHADSNEFRTNH
jgi:hypothetical protein